VSRHIEKRTSSITSGEKDIAERVKALDWERIRDDLDAQGSARIARLITCAECDTLTQLYPQDLPFRSRVLMAQHGFGRGEYKYFNYPLPKIVADLRTAFYSYLVPIANRWNSNGHKRSLPSKTCGFHYPLP